MSVVRLLLWGLLGLALSTGLAAFCAALIGVRRHLDELEDEYRGR